MLYQRWESSVQNGDFVQAQKYYQKMLKDQVAVDQVSYVMGLWFRQYELFEEAILAFEHELTLDQGNSGDIFYEMANTFLEWERPLEAEQYYLQAIALMPDFVDAIFCYGQLLANDQRDDLAREQFCQALVIGRGDVEVAINVAVELSDLGLGEEAIEIYFMALILEPDNYYLYSNLGTEFAEMGDFEAALFCHRKALTYNNFVADLWYNLACTYSMMEDGPGGLLALEKAVALDGGNRDYAGIDPELDFLRTQGRFWKIISE